MSLKRTVQKAIKEAIARNDAQRVMKHCTPCPGCGIPPTITYNDDAKTETHLTCVNYKCTKPHWLQRAYGPRSLDEAVAEWNMSLL